MDESGEIIDNFVTILQQQASDNPNSVYQGVKSSNSKERNTVVAQDVISKVVKQIRDLQAGATSKVSYLNRDKLRKSSPVPVCNVNMLKQKIVSLSQLQTVDQTEEAACIGVTQEFERSFEQEYLAGLPNLNDEKVKDTPFHIIDISLKEPNPNTILELPIRKDIKPKFESQFENCTQVMEECTEIENIDRLDIFVEDIDPEKDMLTQNTQIRSPSPIFSVKSGKTKSKPSSPLVYNLDCFEKFENVASSVIDENIDKDTAKKIINSQIFRKELYLTTDEASYFEENERISPIIQLNTDSFKLDHHLLNRLRKIDTDKNTTSNTGDDEITSSDSKVSNQVEIVNYEDEILFSSDEEDDRCYKSFKDLPFTCALETSFYDGQIYDGQNEVLDKTMYVGFQTASNKTILVKTDSFSKAKNMFDDVDESLTKLATVTDLVELKDKCNSNKSTSINILINKEVDIQEEINAAINEDTTDSALQKISIFSNNIADDLAKESLIQNNCLNVAPNDTEMSVTNSTHDDTVKCEQNTEDIHKLDDEMLLEFLDEMTHKDLDSEPINKVMLDPISELNSISFKTANNKNIIVSNTALEKSKKMLQDIDFSLKHSTIIETCKKNNLEPNINHTGFTTASNKKIEISDKALDRIKSVFHDIDLGELPKERSDCEVTEIAATRAKSFKNTPEKEIKMSKKDVLKANTIFEGLSIQNSNSKEDNNVKRSANNQKGIVNNFVCDEDTSDSDKEPPFLGFDRSAEDEILTQEVFRTSLKIFEKLGDCGNMVYRETTTKELEEHSSVKLLETDTFEGFKTASNKKVVISEKALQKGRKLLQYIEEDKQTSVDNYIKSGDNVCGMYTHDKSTNTQKSQEPHEPFAKRQKLCDFIVEDKNAPSSCFKTASHKPIQVSEKSIQVSRKMFQDINNASSPLKSDMIPEFKGFQTASNKMIKVSEQALKKSKLVFESIDNNFETSAKTFEIPKCVGFQTASNKQVKVSDKALERSCKLFQDIYEGNMELFPEDSERIPFKGFQTSSNKEVKICAKSLEKSRKLLKDVEADTLKKPNPKNRGKSPIFQGFQTASNKKVKVSDMALENSRRLFQDFGENKVVESNLGKVEKFPKFKGFQTASNKDVKISEEALEKSKKILQDCDVFVESHQKQLDDGLECEGFQIACNKEIKISNNALDTSKKLFENEKCTENALKLTHTETKFAGFQTANNNKVKICEIALGRTRKIFENITDCEDEVPSRNATKPDNTKLKFGFITANNNKIGISKDALIKSKAFLLSFNEDKTTSSIRQTKFEESVKDEEFEINTEVINDFDTTFKEITPKNIDMTPRKSKRSGSPILSCPKAKKRKVFQIPYSQKLKHKEPTNQPSLNPPNMNKESQNSFTFSLNYKKFKNYSLKDLKNIEAASNSAVNIDPYILNFDFENLLSFQFFDERNDITDSKVAVADLKKLFQNSVNQKLIPEGWLDIQLKLIIWKLISYEIAFPKTMNLTCTARNVMDQLKYRYNKELYNTERPILRKIMEKDDVSTRTLVLCVVGISGSDDASIPPELILTDGWYTIKALIDKMLSKYVSNGKIKVGTKILTHGAETIGSEQAVSPWEDISSIRLKLFGNSTRRARWDTRLGCHSNAAILSHLSNVTVEGGKVPKLRVLVSRVYPPLYVDKFEDGSTVTRSERLEHLHQMKYESERQAVLDKIYEEVEREVDQDSEDSESSSGYSNRNKNQLDNESRIAKTDRATGTQVLSQLTSTQRERLEEYNEKRREKIMAAIQCKVQDKMAAYGVNSNRNVVTVLKVRVVDIEEKRDSMKVTKALLSIWRPNEAITEVIRENSWIEILNVTPTAFRYSELQLSAGRQSVFSQSKHKETEKIHSYALALKRTCYPIKDLVKYPTMATDYNEVDTIGVIFQTDPATKDFDASKQPFQNVYLADIDKNIICVNFWGGLRKFGFENCLDTGQIVAGINLQKRAGNTRKSIPQYRVTEFSYFTKTPKQDVARKMIEELHLALSKIDRNAFCQECIRLKDNHSIRLQSSENISPYRFFNVDANSSKTKMFLNTPLAQKQNEKDENLHLTGLDFESTFKHEDTQDYSPKVLLRKRQVQQKLAKLKMYGEPPALSPIQIINKSNNAAKAYKSPLISKPDVSCNVANDGKNLPNEQNTSKTEENYNIDCSPVICLNKTYVKKCDAKPVKLNFSKNDESCTDDFAEEFDCSPPLSLE